jgi:hypothetical protein
MNAILTDPGDCASPQRRWALGSAVLCFPSGSCDRDSHITAEWIMGDLWFKSKIFSLCTRNSITENPCIGILIKRLLEIPVLCGLETWKGELIWRMPSFADPQSPEFKVANQE